jgi:predicted MFS family arabinose efflux permease
MTAVHKTKSADRIPEGFARTVPPIVAALAIPTFVAFWIGGNPALGLAWAALSIGFGLALALGSRSDTLRLLRGTDDDERAQAIEYQAMTAVALVLTVALAGLFLASGIRGESGLVYGLLLLTAELVHVTAVAVLNRRS